MYFSECNTGTTGEAIAGNILSLLQIYVDRHDGPRAMAGQEGQC